MLTKNQRLEIFEAICSVQFLEINIDEITFEDKVCNLVWVGIKHSIRTSLDGYVSRMESLNKPIETPLAKGCKEPPCQQEKEQVQEKVKEQYRFIEPEFKKPFNDWLEYKKERREKYKSEKSLKAAYNKLKKLSGNNPAAADEIVEQSMANNWAGMFELKTNVNGKPKNEPEFTKEYWEKKYAKNTRN